MLLVYVSWLQAVVHHPKFLPAVRVRTVIVTLHVRLRLFLAIARKITQTASRPPLFTTDRLRRGADALR